MVLRLPGHTSVITGAASGIGAAIAVRFAQEGASVARVDQDEAGVAEVAGMSRAAGGTAQTITVDVTDHAAAGRILQELAGAWGRLDSLVTSAGISIHGTVASIGEEAWDKVFAVNVKGTYNWVHHAIPHMAAFGSGSVITLGSQLAVASVGNNACYIASKGAIVSLTKTMAVDHAKDGIRINALMPAVIDTPLARRSLANYADGPERRQRWMDRHAMKRLGTPEEVANAALFLVSNEASFVTGSLMFVDGGWTAM